MTRLEELENHHVKVTFAVTAMDSAEDDETLKLISKKGHKGTAWFCSLFDQLYHADLACSRSFLQI